MPIWDSQKIIICSATSISRVWSRLCMPGELLTSKTKGPLLLLSMSTPATDKPRALAALTATDLSFLDRIAFSADPP